MELDRLKAESAWSAPTSIRNVPLYLCEVMLAADIKPIGSFIGHKREVWGTNRSRSH